MEKSNFKLIVIFYIIWGVSMPSYGQTFTKLTDGDIVNDIANSISSNWIDYENDGLLDLLVGNWDANSCLYHNEGNGTFTKVFTENITDDGGYFITSTCGDYNNDGYNDLFISNLHRNNKLLKNNGDCTFMNITDVVVASEGVLSRSSSWGDYDNDGYLDLFVVNSDRDNFLYHNNRNGTFTKIIEGDIVNDLGWSIGCCLCDYNNDGYLDLFVANWHNGENNFLYHNNGDGTFTRIFEGIIVNDGGWSRGASWGDYDNDGHLDLFVANTKNENTNENQNNFLYHNNRDGTFTKIEEGSIVNDGGNSSASCWGDYDNDGDLDLFVANWSNENDFFYSNNGDGTFTKIEEGVVVNDGKTSRGSCCGDYNRDGDLDIFVGCVGENLLYSNNGNDNNWVNILCIGTISNYSSIGAKVQIKANINGNSLWQFREIFGQTGYYAQNSLNVEFGLGNAPIIDSIKVKWPSRIEQILTDVQVNQYITITEPILASGDLNNDENINVLDIIILINLILNGEWTPEQLEVGDMNGDETLDVLDIVTIVNIILHRINKDFPATKAELCQIDNSIFLNADGNIAGLYFIVKIQGSSTLVKNRSPFEIHTKRKGENINILLFGINGETMQSGEIISFSYPVKLIKVIAANSRAEAIDTKIITLSNYSLSQNYPNPFNAVTKIAYHIPRKSQVILTVYDLEGKVVDILVSKTVERGYYTVNWDASMVGSGVYIYKIQTDDFKDMKKCLVVK